MAALGWRMKMNSHYDAYMCRKERVGGFTWTDDGERYVSELAEMLTDAITKLRESNLTEKSPN